MRPLPLTPERPVVASAGPDAALLERLLSDTFGRSVAVGQIQRLHPWCVARVHIADPGDGVPASVIAKWGRNGGSRSGPGPVRTEKAALDLLATCGRPFGPTLIASDHDAAVNVIEDVAPRVALFDLLRDGDDRAREGLRAFARTMGTLHAVTAAGHRRLDPVPRPTWTKLPRFDALAVESTVHAEADLAQAQRTLYEESPLVALSNGDPGANNFLVDGADGRIIDWEFAGYRHALIDAACLYVPGPQWMTLSDPFASGVGDDYRRAVVEGIPEAADDDTFNTGLAAACLVLAIDRLQRLPTLDQRPAGHESRAQMVSTLESAGRAADTLHALPHLAGWAHAAATVLRRRWPDADRTFAVAYTTRD